MEHLKDQLKLADRDVLNTTLLQDIMQTAITIMEYDNLSQAQIRLQTYRVNHLIVLNDRNEVSGILSQKYLYKTQSPRRIINSDLAYDTSLILGKDSFYTKESLNRYILKHIMSKNFCTLKPTHTVADAILNISDKKISCIPIIDENAHIYGMVTDHDIINFLASALLNHR